MVRLVFRPYTQIRRSICTSESLRASTRVSSGFALFRHSSPSFGSQHACSTADPTSKTRDPGVGALRGQSSRLSLSFRVWVCHPNTRRHVRLLGPCFKTGRSRPLCQHLWRERRVSSVPVAAYDRKAITHPRKGATFPSVLVGRPKLMLTRRLGNTPSETRKVDPQPTRLTSSVSLSAISRTV
jgi:hypothetical protein